MNIWQGLTSGGNTTSTSGSWWDNIKETVTKEGGEIIKGWTSGASVEAKVDNSVFIKLGAVLIGAIIVAKMVFTKKKKKKK